MGLQDRRRLAPRLLLLCLFVLVLLPPRLSAEPLAEPDGVCLYLPYAAASTRPACAPIPEESYSAIPVEVLSPDPGVPGSAHPDLNLALRGYRENSSALRSLVAINGATDPNAPRLQTIFADSRYPSIDRVYQVYQWDGRWPGVYGVYPITSPEVTLIGLAATPGEKVIVPYRGPEIFWDTVADQHYVAMVLYAAPDRITIKYTREDHVITGYTVHIEGICVEPRLVALYNQLEAAGRRSLPGLRYGQAIGRAADHELGVAIRDTGSFMDPRSRKDWWQGLVAPSVEQLPVLDVSGEDWYQRQQERLLDHGPVEGD
ncbi:MAG: hypothetical protein GXX94_02225 [Chloroflexi bacterium]|nr:hypothetical protein [Chloroflexota bacterium]